MTYHFYHPDLFSRRAVALAGIASFHFLVAYLLLTALMPPPPPVADPPSIQTSIEEPPLPPAPVVKDWSPSTDHTTVHVPDPPDPVTPAAQPTVTAVTSDPPASDPTGIVPMPPVRQIGSNQLPNTADFYPPDYVRQRIEGATNLRVCVDERGVRQGEPAIEASSGHPRLDVAALEMARHGRYARAVRGDTPVGSCYRFRIVFQIPK